MTLDETVIKYKTDLDACAETGWNEVQTTAYIDSVIKEEPLARGFGEKKVGRIFKIGAGENKIFLRADIDGLPTKNGVKHICGHSTHTASLLAAYCWALDKESELTRKNKQIIFIFQPAEETFPSGAAEIINKCPDIINSCKYGFGIHVAPDIETGSVGIFDGIINAAGDYFEIEVTGTSTHVKSTPKGVDAIEGAAYVVQEFKKFQKTFQNFGRDVVFNIDTIKGGTAPNRVADHVFMNGDIRWFDKTHNKKIKEFFANLPKKLKNVYRGDIRMKYYDGYPPLNNNTQLVSEVTKYIERNGMIQITRKAIRSLGTEDFSFYSAKIPCLYAKIGVKNQSELHDDTFDVPDEGIPLAYQYWQSIIEWFTSKEV